MNTHTLQRTRRDTLLFDRICVLTFAAILRKWIAATTAPYRTNPSELYGRDVPLNLAVSPAVPVEMRTSLVELLTSRMYRHQTGKYPPFALGWNAVTQHFTWERPSARTAVDVYL